MPKLHTAHDSGMRSYTTIQAFQSSDQAVALRRLDGYAHSTAAAATAAAHPLTRDPEDVFSYGTASVIHMLKVDPTTYPDVNPLISTVAGQSPTAQQITGKPTATPSPSPSAAAASPAPSLLVPVLVGGGIILLLVILAIVLIIVFATRRARRKASIQ